MVTFPLAASGLMSVGWTEELVVPGARWRQIEDELSGAGAPVGLYHSVAWAEHGPQGEHFLLVVRDRSGGVVGRLPVRVNSTRALPGHRVITAERFGDGMPVEALEASAAALARYASRDRWILQVRVKVFSRRNREAAAAALEKCGFRRAEQPTSYTHTLTLDLSGDEQAVFSRLRKTARKNLQHAAESGFRVEALTDVAYGKRLGTLEKLSMSRTGGRCGRRSWESILELSKQYPQLSRISGLFLSKDDAGPKKLVAFAWGTMQGDHGTYASAGTMRVPEVKVSLGYPLLWDLIVWSHRKGADWFDFGGVTTGDPKEDRLAGISCFKRHFTHTVEHVGEEWVLEPHPVRAQLARAAGAMHSRAGAFWDLFPSMAVRDRHSPEAA